MFHTVIKERSFLFLVFAPSVIYIVLKFPVFHVIHTIKVAKQWILEVTINKAFFYSKLLADCYWLAVTDTVQKLTSKHKSASLLLYGDFNDLNTSPLEQALGLTQIVDFPTRENAHLDKMYTNIPEYVKARCSLSPPIGNSDHESVVLDTGFKKPVQYESITKRKVTPGAKIKISQRKANTFQQIVTEIFHKNFK